ncbi:hypothetical protein P8452_23731 [Trifolium repens]|nr:hypothetical protein P8452_23731 [Trifolium repens]
MNDAENATNRRNPNREQRKHNVSQPQTTRTDNQKSRNKTRITQNQQKESNKPWTRRTEPRNETRTVLRVDQKGESLYQESRFRDDGHNHWRNRGEPAVDHHGNFKVRDCYSVSVKTRASSLEFSISN